MGSLARMLARKGPSCPPSLAGFWLVLLLLFTEARAAAAGMPPRKKAAPGAAPEAAGAPPPLGAAERVPRPVHFSQEVDWDDEMPQNLLRWRVWVPVAYFFGGEAESQEYLMGTITEATPCTFLI